MSRPFRHDPHSRWPGALFRCLRGTRRGRGLTQLKGRPKEVIDEARRSGLRGRGRATDPRLHRHRPTPSGVARAHRAALTCMTASTNWPRIGPAAYRATTREDGLRREANVHVDSHFVPSPQVEESDARTLSRWRHGFKSRWDYKRELAGQRHSAEAAGSLNGDSNAEYPENIPSQVVRSGLQNRRTAEGWIHRS
jgi:hypothetical protein